MQWHMNGPPGSAQQIMMPPSSIRTIVMPQVPTMVRVAMEYVALVDGIRSITSVDGSRAGWRALSSMEETAYDNALGVVARYFSGRQKFVEKPDVIEVVKGS